jgi:hypothetical protein
LTADALAGAQRLLLAASAEEGWGEDEGEALDLSEVDAIDVKGVQLIAAFLKARSGNRIERPSPEVRALFVRLGAFPELQAEP